VRRLGRKKWGKPPVAVPMAIMMDVVVAARIVDGAEDVVVKLQF
jgi:hypothetical protein